jgi:hypothetical protein
MRRREFTVLAAAAVAMLGAPAARAQPGAVPVIGFLNSESPALMSSRLAAFRAGIAGPMGATSACRHWRRTWFAAGWP